ncbi:tyrosine-type recombinase/integrase [Pseudooceanicola sp. 216_PA32_1]|uniref:Tyrosine-type recombinase/integrase n=1 Tax=Pseudooceanicola pacificus TaxID=2676438 RepID=A0A844W529_9RHOB|nr:site-specific integrase [Pseudooceanicola pacificus]MWB79376.1 tyrosine-type recombinase/integrase [Pseudooceanicola pacificus]
MPSTNPHGTAQRLSQGSIAALQPHVRDYFVRDTEVRGLQVKVTPAGKKSFIVRYRNSEGKERKHKLSDVDRMNLSTARRMAQELLSRAVLGDDPTAERTARRKQVTLKDYGERFLTEHVEVHLAPSSQAEYRRILERYVFPALGAERITSIARDEIEALKRSMAHTPKQANRMLAITRKMYNHAIQNNHASVAVNPVQFVKGFKEEPRERFLTKSEQERVIEAISELRETNPENTSSYDAIVFLFLTGRRRSEVLQLKWSDVDFERGVIFYRKTKTDPQKSLMSADMRTFLLDIRETASSEYVFPGRVKDKPLTDPKRSWKAIQKLAGLEGVRLHDIRHTIVSEVTANSSLQNAALVAGHKSLQSTMRYVHGISAEATKALEEAGQKRSGMLARKRKEQG